MKNTVDEINQNHTNEKYLPSADLPTSLVASKSILTELNLAKEIAAGQAAVYTKEALALYKGPLEVCYVGM